MQCGPPWQFHASGEENNKPVKDGRSDGGERCGLQLSIRGQEVQRAAVFYGAATLTDELMSEQRWWKGLRMWHR